MYLYDTPRDTMANDLMFQSLCLTSTWKAPKLMPNTSNYLFMCSRAPRSTQIINHSCALDILAQDKTSHQSCASWSTPNTNNNNWLTPNIYIYHQQLAYAQYIKKIIMFICIAVFDPIYQNKTSR